MLGQTAIVVEPSAPPETAWLLMAPQCTTCHALLEGSQQFTLFAV